LIKKFELYINIKFKFLHLKTSYIVNKKDNFIKKKFPTIFDMGNIPGNFSRTLYFPYKVSIPNFVCHLIFNFNKVQFTNVNNKTKITIILLKPTLPL
jgi:hypothetical protein